MSTNTSKTPQNSKMKETQSYSWGEVWMATPGPKNFNEHLTLFVKGICMGTADTIPGVSGGTIAFITGIYGKLIKAISSINGKFLQQTLKMNFKTALSECHLRFLSTLSLGIALAIISTANLMHFLLLEFPVQTWSIFFGLILASILVLGHSIRNRFTSLPALILGSLFAYFITSLIPLQTPEYSWFIFLCGVIGVCAMILPGISGSFVLLILGKYAYIIMAFKNPFIIDNFKVILIFSLGCLIGIISFSRILSYALANWHDHTLAFLTGIMIGCMRKVWPWKITLESEIIKGKEYIVKEENIWPLFNLELVKALILICLGFVLVITLAKMSKNNSK